MPVSCTSILTRSPTAPAFDPHRARLGVLDGVLDQVADYSPQQCPVGPHRQCRGDGSRTPAPWPPPPCHRLLRSGRTAGSAGNPRRWASPPRRRAWIYPATRRAVPSGRPGHGAGAAVSPILPGRLCAAPARRRTGTATAAAGAGRGWPRPGTCFSPDRPVPRRPAPVRHRRAPPAMFPGKVSCRGYRVVEPNHFTTCPVSSSIGRPLARCQRYMPSGRRSRNSHS